MSVSLLNKQLEEAKSAASNQNDDESEYNDGVYTSESSFVDSQGDLHQGSLKIDATCADAEVRYTKNIDFF